MKTVIEMAREAGFVVCRDESVLREMLERFAALVSAAKCKELADQIDKMPFGNTAASFAVWIREQA